MNRVLSQTLLIVPIVAMSVLLVLLWPLPERELLLSLGAVILIAFSMVLERLRPHSGFVAQIGA